LGVGLKPPTSTDTFNPLVNVNFLVSIQWIVLVCNHFQTLPNAIYIYIIYVSSCIPLSIYIYIHSIYK
jgi:hypothetical protein